MEDYMTKQEETHRTLQCVLTNDELLKYSRELAQANQDLSALEDKKKDVVAGFTAQAKRIEADINMNALKVSTGKEMRDVKCVWDYDYERKIKILTRLDTGEVLQEDELTPEELQEVLPLEGVDPVKP
jgi:hypothetical protein